MALQPRVPCLQPSCNRRGPVSESRSKTSTHERGLHFEPAGRRVR